ncbi:MAG: GC-type dockerin domain-anchored protein [Phycisphaerales bacterium]
MNRQNTALTLGMLVAAGAAIASPIDPVYTVTFADCITSDNQYVGPDGELRWDVDAGCDIYQIDLYERPMTQAFDLFRGRFGAKEYLEYVDIAEVRAGFDDRYLYVSIKLAGRDLLTSGGDRDEQGLVERYGFTLSTDRDGRFGVLLVADQPELKIDPVSVFGTTGVFGYRDTDGDVGGAADSGPTGRDVTKTDNPDEESGLNGYDTTIISDGVLDTTSREVLFVRLSPTDDTVVEFALDYAALGFTQDDLRTIGSFEIEAIKGGPKDPQNYRFNDKYSAVEAGSPNLGSGGLSEFGTEGLEAIYEMDTVRGGPIDGGTACRADCDGDGALSIFDFLCFQNLFDAGDLRADFDHDGALTLFDFLAFQNAFDAGC